VNNYQRLQDMPPKKEVQFVIQLPCGPLVFPQNPVTIPSDACLIWPFNLDLGQGVRLLWATAQPLTAIDDATGRTVFFAETEGVPAQFAFATNSPKVQALVGSLACVGNAAVLTDIKPGPGVAATMRPADGHCVQIVLLDRTDSLALWKGRFQGRDRVFLTRAGLVLDGNNLRLTSTNSADLSVAICPAPESLAFKDGNLTPRIEGVFERFTPCAPRAVTFRVGFENIQAACSPRETSLGKIEQPVATAPLDADFERAAVWRVHLPEDIALDTDPILRFHYVGDVARVQLNGKLMTDDFYNGNAFDVGLRRHAPDILKGDLRIAVLPLRQDAPVYMAESARPDFSKRAAVAEIEGIEILPRYQVQLTAQGKEAALSGRR
jgi:hypothetical protein